MGRVSDGSPKGGGRRPTSAVNERGQETRRASQMGEDEGGGG